MLAEPAALAAAVAIVLLAPSPPLLFMGEEFGATTPFLYFCDFDAAACRGGARRQAAASSRASRAFGDAADPAAIPDPQAPETFARSKLDWASQRAAGARELARALPRAAAASGATSSSRCSRQLDPQRCGFAHDRSAQPCRALVDRDGATPAAFRQSRRRARRPAGATAGQIVYTTGNTAAEALAAPWSTTWLLDRRRAGDHPCHERSIDRSSTCASVTASPSGYEDAWGAARRTPEATKLALLRAMGDRRRCASANAWLRRRHERRRRRCRRYRHRTNAPDRIALQLVPSSAPPGCGSTGGSTWKPARALEGVVAPAVGAASGDATALGARDPAAAGQPDITACRSATQATHARACIGAADRHARALLQPAAARRRRADLGTGAAALRAALASQLGHRRLHRLAQRRSTLRPPQAPTSSASIRCTRCFRPDRKRRARTARRIAPR